MLIYQWVFNLPVAEAKYSMHTTHRHTYSLSFFSFQVEFQSTGKHSSIRRSLSNMLPNTDPEFLAADYFQTNYLHEQYKSPLGSSEMCTWVITVKYSLISSKNNCKYIYMKGPGSGAGGKVPAFPALA